MGTSIAEFHPAFQWAVTQALAQCGGASVGGGYRTIEEQRGLLWKRSQGILVADPGTSRHEGHHFGAVDMEGDLECFARAGAQYGLTNGDVPGEPWHFQFTAEAEAAVEAGTYEYGGEEQGEEPQEDTLEGIRSLILGDEAGPEAGDVPARVREGLAEPAAAEPAEGEPTEGPDVTPLTAGAGGSGEPISDVEAARVFSQAGFSGDALVTMIATALGESGLDPDVGGDSSLANGTWGNSIGISQIRSLRDQTGTGGWRDATRLTDPAFNARAAWSISNGGTNFSPWTVYNTGQYTKNMDRAKAAVAALAAAGGAGPAGSPSVASAPPPPDVINPEKGLTDPAGVAQDIAQQMLRNKGRPGDLLERIGDVSEEQKPEIEAPVAPLGEKRYDEDEGSLV